MARDLDAPRPASPDGSAPSLAAIMAQSRDENFPVASRVLPRRERRQLLAVYGVARLIDDVGDEAAGDRHVLLDWLDAELDRVASGAAPEHPAMRALAAARIGATLPVEPFRALIQANRQDQEVLRYETFDQLLGYCRLSAAPVGELVLHVFDAATPDRLVLSEKVCAGLQVVEHIQDVLEDYGRGRIYMPREDMERFGCSETDLSGPEATVALKRLLAFESTRAGGLIDAGAPLARTLPLRPRLAVAGFVAGGRAALDALAHAAYDVGGGAPSRGSRKTFARAFARAALDRRMVLGR
jgi:squalene synthase HpnC